MKGKELLHGLVSDCFVLFQGAMPAFGGRLSDDDIADVATYVIGQAEDGW